MNHLAASIAIGLLVSSTWGQGKSDGGGIAAIGNTFTYQGVLKQNGTAVNGTCDLQLSLWNAVSGPSQIGSTNQFLSQSLTNGLVTQTLDFGTGAFDGNDRWIEIAVRSPAGIGAYTTLAPRQKVNATPYALWALGGAGGGLALPYFASINYAGTSPFQISNTSSTGAGIFGSGELYGVRGNNLSTSNFGILGHPEYGVYGVAVGAPDWGVHGLHNPTGNYGTLGTASSGVYGSATAPDGRGVNGVGDYGVWGESPNANGRGVVGYVTGSGDAVGVYGLHGPTGNYGKLGTSLAGVYGFAPNEVWAGYFEGSVFVDGGIKVNATVVTNRVYADAGAGLESFFTRPDDGLLVTFGTSDETQGSISVTGTTVSYNAFTGSHFGWTDQVIERGALVCLIGDNRFSHDDPEGEVMYGIAVCAMANDSRCLGAELGLQKPAKRAGNDNPHLIMAVGNGDMWVAESSNGNIQPGDYLISSDVEGCAMKDDSNRFPVGYIVARSGEPVDWSALESPVDGSPKRKKISVFFENFVRDSRGTQLANVVEAQQREIESLKVQIAGLQSISDRLARLEGRPRLGANQVANMIGGNP